MGSNQVCVTFLSSHFSFNIVPPSKKDPLIKCQSEVHFRLLLNVRSQNVKCPSSTTLKIKMKVETSIISERHLPLSRHPIQPASLLIINVSMGDRKKWQVFTWRTKPFIISFFLLVFVPNSISPSLFFFSSPFLCMSQVNSVQFKGSLLA